jgi:hypothetical protein
VNVVAPLDFFGHLVWLDGRPLLDTIEPYRRAILTEALHSFEPDGRPRYNLVLSGRAKKNYKTTDLILASFYRFFAWPSHAAGNDCFLLANDEGQAADDLSLAKKLVLANPILAHEVTIKQKAIERLDGRGTLQILPAGDVAGSHGKTFCLVGFDEIHGYRNWDLFEALAPDPTRPDALTWITSYDTIYNAPGVPLFDLKRAGQNRADPRMHFTWYSGDLCTDPIYALLEDQEERANPSMSSWPEGRGYLDQQKARLPTSKYRRLHLNLPGAPDGAFFDPGNVLACIVPGRKRLAPWRPEKAVARAPEYRAFVDMSGGSSDDAVLAIGHQQDGLAIVDLVESQGGAAPFDPRLAVLKFAGLLKEYGVFRVVGDRYAGETFRADFQRHGVGYEVSRLTKSQLYEALEPRVNAGEVELPDLPRLQEQLLTLVRRGARIDHQAGDRDDHANAAAGVVHQVLARAKLPLIW